MEVRGHSEIADAARTQNTPAAVAGMSADTWALIHSYGLAFTLGVIVGAVFLMMWREGR